MNQLFLLLIIGIIMYLLYRIYRIIISNHITNNINTTNKKCYAYNGYVYADSGPKVIERKTYKCLLAPSDKAKLMNLDSIFVPSMMNDTYCDTLYTTYYDYNDFAVLKNRINGLNMPLTKCIRIRRYMFDPNIYFEIKYPGGTKIRALIDDDYNLLEPDDLDPEQSEIIVSIIDKIRLKKVVPIFNNIYKRFSFIYKNNPAIRMTMDTNIEYFQNSIYDKMSNDVLEMKIPSNISLGEAQQYIKEMEELSGIKLKFVHFSKFEYFYYDVLVKQRN